MFFKDIYEAMCRTSAGTTMHLVGDVCTEYYEKQRVKEYIQAKQREIKLAENEKRESLRKMNKEFYDAQRAREQKDCTCVETLTEDDVFDDVLMDDDFDFEL